MKKHLRIPLLFPAIIALLVAGCSDYFKNDYKDNSPTSGKLKVYYDVSFEPHIRNQVRTFMSQYPNTEIELYAATEQQAVQALYADSCELIIIGRDLSPEERKSFASKQYDPKYSKIATSGIALITSTSTPVTRISKEELVALLTANAPLRDTSGAALQLTVIFDQPNSSVTHYVRDSLLDKRAFSENCSSAGNTAETIGIVAQRKGIVGVIDFAWLSDMDDSTYKALQSRIRFLAIETGSPGAFARPSQSSFKLSTYPFLRHLHAIRKTGDFTLAKGFESYLAGPKGQLTFLKQGLLPARQSERNVNVKFEPIQ